MSLSIGDYAMITKSVLSSDAIDKVAFDLITSSTTKRYARMASRAAGAAGLVDKLCGGDEQEFEAILALRGRELLDILSRADDDGEHEAEFATIVAALILANTESGNMLVARIIGSRSPTLQLITAMVGELFAQNQTVHEASLGDCSADALDKTCDEDGLGIHSHNSHPTAANDTYPIAA